MCKKIINSFLPSIIIILLTFIITTLSMLTFNIQSVVTFVVTLIVINIIINTIYVLWSVRRIKKGYK